MEQLNIWYSVQILYSKGWIHLLEKLNIYYFLQVLKQNTLLKHENIVKCITGNFVKAEPFWLVGKILVDIQNNVFINFMQTN